MTLEILDQEIEVLEDLLVEKDHQVLHHLLVGEYHQGDPRGGHQGGHQGDPQEDPQEDPQGGLQGGPELVQGPQVLGMVSNNSCVGGAGVDPPTYIMRAFFLMPLALSMPIFNNKSLRSLAVETFKIWPKFESFHSLFPMRFFVENWHTKSQGHKKNCPHFLRRRVCLFPFHTAGN